MGNTHGKYPWEIPMGNTHGKYPWEIPMGNTHGKYPWEIPMENTHGISTLLLGLQSGEMFSCFLEPYFEPYESKLKQ